MVTSNGELANLTQDTQKMWLNSDDEENDIREPIHTKGRK